MEATISIATRLDLSFRRHSAVDNVRSSIWCEATGAGQYERELDGADFAPTLGIKAVAKEQPARELDGRGMSTRDSTVSRAIVEDSRSEPGLDGSHISQSSLRSGEERC